VRVSARNANVRFGFIAARVGIRGAADDPKLSSGRLCRSECGSCGCRGDAGLPTVGIRRHLAGTDHPALPTGLRSPPRRGHRTLGASAAVLDPGHRLPVVALVPHRRQNDPNNPPPTRATAISEGQVWTAPALQKRSGVALWLDATRSHAPSAAVAYCPYSGSEA
jgi:hypothetical protein